MKEHDLENSSIFSALMFKKALDQFKGPYSRSDLAGDWSHFSDHDVIKLFIGLLFTVRSQI